LGQFPPDLFDGRLDYERNAIVAQLGGQVLAQLILASNQSADWSYRLQNAGSALCLAPLRNEQGEGTFEL